MKDWKKIYKMKKWSSFWMITIISLLMLNGNSLFAQTADAGVDKEICKGDTIELEGVECTECCYKWSPTTGFLDPDDADLPNPMISPTSTTTYTFTVTGPDFSFKDDDNVEISVAEIELKKLEFTSDHNLMTDGADLVTHGSRFPDIEWDPDASVNAPISHTSGTSEKIEIKLIFEVSGLSASTPFELTGTSGETALNFTKTGTISNGANVEITVTATNALGEDIRKIEEEIEWKIDLDGSECDLDKTGPHKIFTTIGTPDDSGPSNSTKPNEARMDLSVTKTAAAIAGSSRDCYPGIIYQLNVVNGAYYLGRNISNPVTAWRLPEVSTSGGAAAYDGNTTPGADCISISTFVSNVSKVMGIPGTFNSKTYMAYYKTAGNPTRPNDHVIGTLNSPLIKPGNKGANLTAGLDPNWIQALADVNCNGPGAAGQVGCSGGLNAFEAAVEYTYSGTTYYFPGGTTLAYTNPDHVVQIFQTMAWVGNGDHDSNPVTPDVLLVKAVDFTYTAAPSVSVCP